MLTVLIVQTSLPLAVHAEDNPWGVVGGDVDDNGTGGGSGGGSYFDELGIQQDNSGYRIYLEEKGGGVVGGHVVELYFNNEPPDPGNVNLKEGRQTTIGGATVPETMEIYYGAIKHAVPGLITPIEWHIAQGVYLNSWFE